MINNEEVVKSGGGNVAGGSYEPHRFIGRCEPEDIDMVSCMICGHSFAKDDCDRNDEGYWICEKCSKIK